MAAIAICFLLSLPHVYLIKCSVFFIFCFFLEACVCSIPYTPLTKSGAHLLSWFIIMFRINCKDTSTPAVIHSYELDRYLEFFHFGVCGRYAMHAGGGEIWHAVSGFNGMIFFFVIMFVEHLSVE